MPRRHEYGSYGNPVDYLASLAKAVGVKCPEGARYRIKRLGRGKYEIARPGVVRLYEGRAAEALMVAADAFEREGGLCLNGYWLSKAQALARIAFTLHGFSTAKRRKRGSDTMMETAALALAAIVYWPARRRAYQLGLCDLCEQM